MSISADIRVLGAILTIALLIAAPPAHADYESAATQALDYLDASISDDGSWGDPDGPERELRHLITSEVVVAWRANNHLREGYFRGITWLENHPVSNSDFASRRIVALARHGDDVSRDMDLLEAAESDLLTGNAGWGLSAFYEGDVLDTALVLVARAEVGGLENLAAAITFLADRQSGQGSWQWAADTTPDVALTATVARALDAVLEAGLAAEDAQAAGDAAASLQVAITFLESQSLEPQLSSASTLTLAHVALAVLRDSETSPAGAILLDELIARQDGVSGAIGGPLSTAVSLQALARALGRDDPALRIRVDMPDSVLRAVINQDLEKSRADLLVSGELATLVNLNLENLSVSSLKGLEYATRLESLRVGGTSVTDFSFLDDLDELRRPEAEPDAATVLAGAEVLTEVLSNDRPANLGEEASLALLHVEEGKLVCPQGCAVVGDTSSVGNAIHFDTLTDFNHLAPGETALVDVRYGITDATGLPSLDDGELLITVVGNAPPEIDENVPLQVVAGTNVKITEYDLAASDLEDAAADLTYTITAGPAYGRIELTSAPGVSISAFTQEQIDNQQVAYAHDGATVDRVVGLEDLASSGGTILHRGADGKKVFMGHVVAPAGDVNDDGRPDMLVSAYGSSLGTTKRVGLTYVVFGQDGDWDPNGIDVTQLADPNDPNAIATVGFEIQGASRQGDAGFSIAAAGDVNDDGVADIIVGAPKDFYFDSLGEKHKGGRAFVVFGRSATAPPFRNTVRLADVGPGGSVPGLQIRGPEKAAFVGYSVAGAGDVNGDGIDDVVVGSIRGHLRRPAVFVVYGRPDSEVVDIDLEEIPTDPNDIGDPNDLPGFVVYGFGRGKPVISVAGLGDVSGNDDLDEILVSLPANRQDGLNGAGETYVIVGRPVGTPRIVDVTQLSAADGFRFHGYERKAGLGTVAAALGDIDGDGAGDFVIGAPGASRKGGKSLVVLGESAGFPAAGLDLAGVDPPASESTGLKNVEAATSVALAGDFNGDGRPDLIIGAPGARVYSPEGKRRNDAGHTYIVFGTTAGGFPSDIDLSAHGAPAGLVVEGARAKDQSGTSVAGVGDVNGDGRDDVLIGAKFAGVGRDKPGRAYIVFGRPDDSFDFELRDSVGAVPVVGTFEIQVTPLP